MSAQTETNLIQVLPDIGRALLVTGGFGMVLLLSSLGLPVISTSLALSVILWASRALGKRSGFRTNHSV